MQRRDFITGLVSAALCASQAAASSFETGIIEQLRAQGFGGIKVEKTLLGRLRITASKADYGREIVINPRTGEILRDIVIYKNGNVSPRISEGRASQSGNGSNASSGNSGNSGNSGSGHGDDGNENENEQEHEQEDEQEQDEGSHGGDDGDDDDEDE